MKQPLFSIATPCFNSAKTIERTIKSVLAQEFKDYEYIIVDGGSTDGTLDIIKQYEPLFEGRMHWKSEPDKGLYDAFNKGIERSTGIYCWNVNADDFIEPDALKNLKIVIEQQDQNNLPVISGAMHFLKEDGITLIRDCISSKYREILCYKKNGMGVNHPATLVPRYIYDKYGTFDTKFKISGDMDWFNRICKAKVPILHLAIFITNMTDGGVSNQPNFVKFARDRWLQYTKKYDNFLTIIFYFMKWTINYLRKKI